MQSAFMWQSRSLRGAQQGTNDLATQSQGGRPNEMRLLAAEVCGA